MSFQFIISCLYFFAPAYFTNMTPPLANRMKVFLFLDKPIDSNKTLRGKPILGPHKTLRGAILGISIGVLICHLQAWLYQYSLIKELSLIDYSKINVLFFGFLISGGAIFGDLCFAFLKRRLNLKPGARFIPFDQINYVIGSWIFLTPFFQIDILVWLNILILTFFLHILINRLGYHLKLHKAKW